MEAMASTPKESNTIGQPAFVNPYMRTSIISVYGRKTAAFGIPV
jgi:hypothetical protein